MKASHIIIAGPCATESQEQIDIAIAEISKRDVDFMRVNLWKPRTKPGFEGLGEAGLPLLIRVAQAGISPGLEVIVPEQVTLVMNAVLPQLRPDGQLLLWVGARNQNHIVQQEIARRCAEDSRVVLMYKNQPWHNDDHWEGILEHALKGGIARENLLNCHRGFAPHGTPNPLNLRNIPDFEAADRVKAKTGIPVIFDPSHTGGSVPNVYKMAQGAQEARVDGLIIEVHHDPANALTDKTQQVTWEQFDEIMDIVYPK